MNKYVLSCYVVPTEEKEMSVTVEFDQEATYSVGHWKCPTCNSQFYGGGPALHDKGCSEDGYENCILVLGPSAVQGISEWAEREGDENAYPPLIPVNLKELREQIPEALAEVLS